MSNELEQKIEEILTRGVAEVIDKEHLKSKIKKISTADIPIIAKLFVSTYCLVLAVKAKVSQPTKTPLFF